MCSPHATTFWLEAGAMGTGGSRNQLEMPDELAVFFGDDARTDEIVTIQLAPGVQHIRPFVYRGDDYGHFSDRWRLCLPTARMGGPDYVNKVVRFDKVRIGNAMVFQLTVTDLGSAANVAWQGHSVPPNGGRDNTLGGRQYGWWS